MRPPSATQSRAVAVAPAPRGFPVVACPESIARGIRCLLLTHISISGKVTLSAEGLPVFGNPTMTHRRLLSIRKGAFTEALQRRVGRFELANGGTIVLAENRRAAAGH